jgi:Tfp pilus assembly protein PilE
MLRRFKDGFTLVELSISIAFIAILSITITLLTTNIIASYQRGLTLKQINTTGTDLINDIKSSISNSSSKNLTDLCGSTYADESVREACENDKAQNFVSLSRSATVTLNGESIGVMPVYGAFCTGTYSYIWNSGYFFSGDHGVSLPAAKLIYKNEDGAQKTAENFRLLKLNDPSRSVCVAMTLNGSATSMNEANYNPGVTEFSNEINISNLGLVSSDPIELLDPNNEYDLALYGLAVARPAQDSLTRNVLYSGYFILATIRGGININVDGDYCSAPSEYSTTTTDYCAINKFNFAIQASGE